LKNNKLKNGVGQKGKRGTWGGGVEYLRER